MTEENEKNLVGNPDKGETLVPRRNESDRMYSTGLWKKQGKKGPYLSGQFEDYWVNVFQKTDPEETSRGLCTSLIKLTPKNQEGDFSFSNGVVIDLYAKTSKKNNNYFAGFRDGLVYHVYPNTKKTQDKHPDYNLVVYDNSNDRKRYEGADKQATAEPESAQTSFEDDNIPF